MGSSTDSLFSLVSPWMSNGTAVQYIHQHPEIDRLHIMYGVAEGLVYLHQHNIIHVDLKGVYKLFPFQNLFINDRGCPVLADFGLSRLAKIDETLTFTTTSSTSTNANPGGTVRFMAPELFSIEGHGIKHSRATDIWAFGCVILEIMTGILPFSQLKQDYQVIHALSTMKLPYHAHKSVPPPFDQFSELWAFCQSCWNIDPKQRPKASEAKYILHHYTEEAMATSSVLRLTHANHLVPLHTLIDHQYHFIPHPLIKGMNTDLHTGNIGGTPIVVKIHKDIEISMAQGAIFDGVTIFLIHHFIC
ncbi:kinase-like protein [Sistotremastrum suecicum HHB10207 ss-3]|uniref:Kinase-like protein n=1 Tax=Sistotremastrum suecicum HHB10207 ss-3 TaxID=1314776 RepID=A0A166DF28_9AGAM|nr:kinase-like protein [Sistotremastrum suecicum HHB10207 ss-3]